MFGIRVFLSYAHEDRNIAEAIYFALSEENHRVFFDKASLSKGTPYRKKILREVRRTDLFVFLISPSSVKTGGFALSELSEAKRRWPRPNDRVLPVVIRDVDLDSVPPYLREITFLVPEGETSADVATHVATVGRRRVPQRLAAVAFVVVGVIASFYVAINGVPPNGSPGSAELVTYSGDSQPDGDQEQRAGPPLTTHADPTGLDKSDSAPVLRPKSAKTSPGLDVAASDAASQESLPSDRNKMPQDSPPDVVESRLDADLPELNEQIRTSDADAGSMVTPSHAELVEEAEETTVDLSGNWYSIGEEFLVLDGGPETYTAFRGNSHRESRDKGRAYFYDVHEGVDNVVRIYFDRSNFWCELQLADDRGSLSGECNGAAFIYHR